MAKKATAKVKKKTSKPKKKQVVTKRGSRPAAAAAKIPPKPSIINDPRFQQAVQNYESALRAMQERKWDKASGMFEKVVAGPSKELADRASVHMNMCKQAAARTSTTFKSQEEHYDFAISLLNSGQYGEAKIHLEKILRQNDKFEHAWYGLALVSCLTGHVEQSLKDLTRAIALDPHLRFQARNDSDFQRMADDPRFTELLYPEAIEEAPRETKPRR